MPKIYLSLGSNIKPEENLNKAKELLSQEYQLEKESKTYKTKSEGFEGEDFLNQVVCLTTEDSAEEVVGMLKDIEKKDTGEITMIYDVIVELEDQEKPVLAAEWITKAFVKP